MTLWCESGNIKQLENIPPEKTIVVDTETTGLKAFEDEILQLAIIDGYGNTLFNEYIKPVHKKTWRKAQAVHHISPAKVKDKPSFDFFKTRILEIFQEAELLVGYNLEYDLNFLLAEGIPHRPGALKFDVMKEFSPVHNWWNEYFDDFKWRTLSECANYYNYVFTAHDALEDAKATLHCFKSMLTDKTSGGYLEICEFLKGKSLWDWFVKTKDEWEYKKLSYAKRNAENEPFFDEVDENLFFCYIEGIQSALKDIHWYSNEYGEKENLKLHTIYDSIKKICHEKSGRLYNSRAKNVKWIIVMRPSDCSYFDHIDNLHKKGYKVARWPEFLEFLGLGKEWDLDEWRNQYQIQRKDITNNFSFEDKKRLSDILNRGYINIDKSSPEFITATTITSKEQTQSELIKAEEKHYSILPSNIYKKICEKIREQRIAEEKSITEIACKACSKGKDTAWLYFVVRNDMALGLLHCSEENFLEANKKFFPNMSKELLFLRRKQATRWIYDSNVYRTQMGIIHDSTLEERHVMLVRNFLERINPIDPIQHIDKAYQLLQYFFTPDEQAHLWSNLQKNAIKKKWKKLEYLSLINRNFITFESAKKYLSIIVEKPNKSEYDFSNPYNFLSANVYFYVALTDEEDKELCIKLCSDQAWVWGTSVKNIYQTAIQNIKDKRGEGYDAELQIRQLLPQYFI